jgi:hypothetical protein
LGVLVIKAHLIVKGLTPGDVFFIELHGGLNWLPEFASVPDFLTAFSSGHRIAVPVGESSLILLRILKPESLVLAKSVPSSPEKDLFNLEIDDMAFKCGDSGAILINFCCQDGEYSRRCRKGFEFPLKLFLN